MAMHRFLMAAGLLASAFAVPGMAVAEEAANGHGPVIEAQEWSFAPPFGGFKQGQLQRGYRVYNLYQLDGDQTRSRLVQNSPADFFAGAHRLDAGVIIPDVRLQKKLLSVIASPTYSALHNPQYSVLANPNTTRSVSPFVMCCCGHSNAPLFTA